MQALILAAGMGKRLKELTQNNTKCMVKVGGVTLIDRMLHQIEIRGILPRLKGIVVGHFSKYKEGESGFETMYDMLHEYLRHYDIPVCYDFPIGHHSGFNWPLVEGCRVRLTVTADGTQLDFRY